MEKKAHLIKSLEIVIDSLKNDTIAYNWLKTHSCNMGVVAQALLGVTRQELNEISRPLFMDLPGESKTWKKGVKYNCPITGEAIPEIIKRLEAAGLHRNDIVHLEYLDNSAILANSTIEKIKISLGSERFELAELRCQTIIQEMKESHQFSYTALFIHPRAVAEYVLILLELANFLAANDKRLEWLINGMLSTPNAQTKNGLIMIQASSNEPPPTYEQVTCMLDTLFKSLSMLIDQHHLEAHIAPQLAANLPKVEQIVAALKDKLTSPCLTQSI
jgi:hypothetical protein